MSNDQEASARARKPRPRAVAAACVVAVILGLSQGAGGVVALFSVHRHVMSILADHPDLTQSDAYAIVWTSSLTVATLNGLIVFAGRPLMRGARWSWRVLVILAALGILLAAPRPANALWSGPLSLLLLGFLVWPSTRDYVRDPFMDDRPVRWIKLD